MPPEELSRPKSILFSFYYPLAHSGKIRDMVMDDKNVYTCCWDGSIRVWSKKSFKLVATLGGHKEVSQLAVDDKYLFSRSGSEVWVWKKKDFTVVAIFSKYLYSESDAAGKVWKKLIGYPSMMMVDDQFLVIGSGKHFVTVYRKKDFSEVDTFGGGYLRHESDDPRTPPSITSDEEYIFLGLWDKTAKVISKKDFSVVATLSDNPCCFITVKVDDSYIYIGSSDYSSWNSGKLQIYRKSDFSFVTSLLGQLDKDTDIAMDNENIYAAFKKTVKVYRMGSFKQVASLSGHSDGVTEIVVDNEYIFVELRDKTIHVWQKSDFTLVTSLSGQFLAEDDKYIYTNSDEKIQIWQKSDFTVAATLSGHSDKVLAAVVENEFIYTRSDKEVCVWQKRDFSLAATFSSYTGGLWSAAMVVDDKFFYAKLSDNTIKIFRKSDFSPVTMASGNPGFVWDLMADDENFYTEPIQGIMVLRKDDFDLVGTLSDQSDRIKLITVDDKLIFTKLDSKIKVFRKSDLSLVATFSGDFDITDKLVVGDDQNIYTVSSEDREKVLVFRKSDFSVATALSGHSNSIWAITMDDENIYTGSWDSTAKVWRRRDFKLVATLSGLYKNDVTVDDQYIFTRSPVGAKVWSKKDFKEVTNVNLHPEMFGWSNAVCRYHGKRKNELLTWKAELLHWSDWRILGWGVNIDLLENETIKWLETAKENESLFNELKMRWEVMKRKLVEGSAGIILNQGDYYMAIAPGMLQESNIEGLAAQVDEQVKRIDKLLS